MNPCRILTLLAAVLLVTPAIAADYYVSLSGKDTNAGTLAAPWRTIQKAASSVPAGSIVNIRSGTYNEMVQITVSGKSGARIVFQSAPGEQAKIDGTGLKLPLHEAPLIRLTDRDYVTIQNLELCNVTTTDDKTMPMGIFIDSSGVGIEIRNCKIHDILQNNTKKNNFNANAHGIGAYGSSPTGISALVIDGCEVYNLHLGASESIALNGNVTGFRVTNNSVHDANNIGIDMIGYERTNRNAALDRARDGVCSGNRVYNIDASFNPAYGGDFVKGGGDSSADGIYVDGGTRILMERNEVFNCNIGIELASEHSGGTADFITVRDNIMRQNHVTGLSLGGYAKDKGTTQNCTITNNTIIQNDTRKTWSGQIQLQYYVSNCVFKNNILQAASATKQMIVNQPGIGTGNVVDYNLYYCDTGSVNNLECDLANKSYSTLAAWQKASGFDKNSVFAQPGFTSPAAGKYDLSLGSAAIDHGDPSFVPTGGELDFRGLSRLVGKRVDIGANEYGAK